MGYVRSNVSVPLRMRTRVLSRFFDQVGHETTFIILVSLTVTLFSEKCLFPLDAYMVTCPTRSKNLERTLMRTE